MRATGILFVILNLAAAMAAAKQNDVCVNGTVIGSLQRFQVHCSSTARGRRTTSVDVPTLDDCADACARANPRCTAATYDGKSCAFHNETSEPLTAADSNFKFTAVVGLPDSSSSNCRSVVQATTMQTINGVQFSLSCGTNMASESLSNHYASSLQDCMGQCAMTSRCKAVSFNADQTLGYQNCFLKSKESEKNMAVSSILDTAVVVRQKDPVSKSTDKDAEDNNNNTTSADTNTMIIVAVSISGLFVLISLGFLSYWIFKRTKRQKRMRSLPVGVMPISHRDRMDEKYGVRTSVAWSEMDRESVLSGEADGVGRPTPVYEIRRKGESYNVGN